MGDPVFKGCTRPSMLGGVPLMPLMIVSLPLVLISMWGLWLKPIIGFTALVLMIPIFIVMKITSKFDDQRLMQHVLRLQMSLRHRNTQFWGAKSYAPVRYKKRKHVMNIQTKS